MNEFVEACRREWKRLGVPYALADEMAADLAADLNDAAAEGVSPEGLLGSSAHDPSAFAASWASERGVVRVATARRRPLALTLFTGFAAFWVVVAALLLATGEPKVSLTTSGAPRGPLPHTAHVVQASAAAPVEWILLVVAVAALAFAAWLWSRRAAAARPRRAALHA